MVNKYGSRKFVITLVGMLSGVVCSAMGFLSAELSAILTTAILAYNGANSYLESKRTIREKDTNNRDTGWNDDLGLDEVRR